MSDTTTKGIRIQVEPAYMPDRSQPERGVCMFSYQITITNTGDAPAQLISRHWVITDGDGAVQNVRGPGVIGEQPRLEPAQSFQYSSFCPLPTPVGTMHGSFQMVRDDGESFDAEIKPFTLAIPGVLN